MPELIIVTPFLALSQKNPTTAILGWPEATRNIPITPTIIRPAIDSNHYPLCSPKPHPQQVATTPFHWPLPSWPYEETLYPVWKNQPGLSAGMVPLSLFWNKPVLLNSYLCLFLPIFLTITLSTLLTFFWRMHSPEEYTIQHNSTRVVLHQPDKL